MPSRRTRGFLNSGLGHCLLALFFSTVALCAGNITYDRQTIRPGVEYIHKQVNDVPWSIHVARIERNRRELKFVTTLPEGQLLGLSPTTEQIKFLRSDAGVPIAAINGDFFSWRKGPYQGDPQSLQIMNGELVSGPLITVGNTNRAPRDAVAFWLDGRKPRMERVVGNFEIIWPNGVKTPFRLNQERTNDNMVLYTHIAGSSTRTTNGVELILERAGNRPWLPLRMGETLFARVREIGRTNTPLDANIMVLSLGQKTFRQLGEIKPGAVLKISTTASPSLKKIETAIGGWPVLAQNGKAMKFKSPPQRHPRTAFGWNKKYFFFVVVDGRRKGISDGMTFGELAEQMVELGCTEAMNLDGGGSAMLWIDGQIRNQPSENRERPCANALVLVRKEK